MAPAAHAARKSRQRASSTASTTASTAPRSQKSSNDAVDSVWSPSDQEAANAQGWGIFECIDEKSLKIFFEAQSHGTRFSSDNEARVFIMNQNKAGDSLAIKALGVVFRSKAGSKGRTK